MVGVWVAFPCGTFRLARHLAVRDGDHIDGLPKWRGCAREWRLIQLGNSTLAAAQRICKAALHLGVIAVAENPAGSFAWRQARWKPILASPRSTWCEFDFCRFGASYRKRTKLLCINCDLQINHKCLGSHGFCSNGRRHQQLIGAKMTSSAQVYPSRLTKVLAARFFEAVESKILHKYRRHS